MFHVTIIYHCKVLYFKQYRSLLFEMVHEVYSLCSTSNAKHPIVSSLLAMLQIIEHTQNHLDWRTAYGTTAVHYCHAQSRHKLLQNRECPHSTRYESDASACTDEAECVLLSAIVDEPVLSSCCVRCRCCCYWWSSSSAPLASNTTSNAAMKLWLMARKKLLYGI